MGGNKDNMRQAMKELLGLVGFGPEEEAAAQERGAAPVEQPKPKAAERPVAQERPKAPERPVAQEQPKIVREPAVERPKAPERPVAQEQPKVVREPAVERPVVQEQPKVAERPVAQEQPRVVERPVVERPVVQEQPKVSYEEAKPAERGFFSFGGRRVKEKEREPVYTAPAEPVYQKPVEPVRPVYTPPVDDFSMEEGHVRPPFIRPGATVIAAGATFFGDIRAEGDVEVLGKVKGNLEATGNVRVLGKVLGDVKGEAVELQGCTVQGNITSTSFVSLDAGAMVVGDVLATDFESDGKVKGNLQIARAANFSSCALLAGNVIAATIVMAQGARVQGAVRIAEDPETNALFGELEI